MKYHDNNVFIKLKSFYNLALVGGSYTVDEFSVTAGQDPDNRIYAGLTVNFDSDGMLSFKAGRSGSDTTANWFNARIKPSQNTFNHTAGELNFALIGTLLLTFKAINGSSEVTFSFKDVAIAQGHSGASNNWWFGGEHCANVFLNNTVLCAGTNSNGGNVVINIMRGGNGTNEIYLLPSPDCTYRDNEVYININKHGYALVDGKFTVSEFCVSAGQDPLGNIYNGFVQNLNSDGKMSFRLGRYGTVDTAYWFNQIVSAEQNTFGHAAGALNFAILGTLELTLTGGILGSGKKSFIFQNVAIAQGHTGARNNWWFGGKFCQYIAGEESVIARGVLETILEISFKFQRGGGNVNAINVDPFNFFDTRSWMNQIRDTTTLNCIVMPGSHDAGMSEVHNCLPPVIAGGYSQTQGGSIKQQLLDGSRYFDIRVNYEYDELVTCHRDIWGGVAWGCSGQSLKSVLDQVVEFLNTYKTETAIIKFSHVPPRDEQLIIQKTNELVESYSEFLYSCSSPSINLCNLQINSVRGRMILVFDYSEFISPDTGRFKYEDLRVDLSTIPVGNLVVYDKYSETSDYTRMSLDQTEKWNKYGGLGQDFMFLLSWTLTPSPPAGSFVKTLAKEANSKLPEVLTQQINVNQKSRPNIVYIDYLNAEIASAVILYNFFV